MNNKIKISPRIRILMRKAGVSEEEYIKQELAHKKINKIFKTIKYK